MSTDLFDQKLQLIIAVSVQGLDEADRNERIAWNAEHHVLGASAIVDGEDLIIRWGGRTLAAVPRSLFDDEVGLEDLRAGFIPEAPDDLSGLLDDPEGGK